MMWKIKLTLKENLAVPLEVENLQPLLPGAGLKDEIAMVPVQYGNKKRVAGDFFAVEVIGGENCGRGTPEEGAIQGKLREGDLAPVTHESETILEFNGELAKVKRIGQGLRAGTVIVNGNAGMHLGSNMTGGKIIVNGDVGDWAGAHMSGGRLVINGNAANFLGSAYWGCKLGMTGGHIIVNGNAGNMAGRKMRRGQITILGDTGDFTGNNMIAGTILVTGKTGRRTGAEMKRGTILLTAEPELLPTFRFNCTYKPVFVNIITGWLEKEGVQVGHLFTNRKFRRYAGDAVIKGKGEILVVDSKTEPQ